MRPLILILSLVLASCGGATPNVPHATLVQLLKGACAVVQQLPDSPAEPQ